MSKGIEPLEMCTKCSLASTRCLFCGTCHLLHCSTSVALRASLPRPIRALWHALLNHFACSTGQQKHFATAAAGLRGCPHFMAKGTEKFSHNATKTQLIKKISTGSSTPFPCPPSSSHLQQQRQSEHNDEQSNNINASW